MHRTRNETKWVKAFRKYPSLEGFLEAPALDGVISFPYRGRDIDILIENRNSFTTLVVFNAALSRKVQEVPNFSGRKLAANLGVNLIALSDPLLHNRNLSVAWYLGDSRTGPLRSVFASAIGKILTELGSKRNIFFGASGGGFAAGHIAPIFAGSMALLVNPRLSLERKSREKMKAYLREAHGVWSEGIGEKERVILREFAPLNLETLVNKHSDYDFLIYQNLLDAEFLRYQYLPFRESLDPNSRLKVRYGSDGPGHVAVPSDRLLNLMDPLTKVPTEERAFEAAGFLPVEQADREVLALLPKIAGTYEILSKSNVILRHHTADYKNMKASFSNLQDETFYLRKQVARLSRQVSRLSAEPSLSQRVWRLVPEAQRKRIKQFINI